MHLLLPLSLLKLVVFNAWVKRHALSDNVVCHVFVVVRHVLWLETGQQCSAVQWGSYSSSASGIGEVCCSKNSTGCHWLQLLCAVAHMLHVSCQTASVISVVLWFVVVMFRCR
jgi:hypothetical protein